jgi:hypothetical protein
VSDLRGPSDEEAEHADIRALLAGLGPGADAAEPLPADVAARLDDTLAALVEERREAGDRDTGGPVVVPVLRPLDRTTRRGRWAPRLLAAATVAAIAGGIGVGIAQLPGGSGSGAASGGQADHAGNSAARPAGKAPAYGTSSMAGLPRLTRQDFRADARRLVASESALRRFDRDVQQADRSPKPAPSTTGSSSARSLAEVLASCGHRPGLPTGARAIPVRLDGKPATVVVVPRADGVAQVTAYPCAGDRVLASATVPR